MKQISNTSYASVLKANFPVSASSLLYKTWPFESVTWKIGRITLIFFYFRPFSIGLLIIILKLILKFLWFYILQGL